VIKLSYFIILTLLIFLKLFIDIIIDENVDHVFPKVVYPGKYYLSNHIHLIKYLLSNTSSSHTNNPSKTTSPLVSQILSTRDNLLAICLKEGKITEANEVIRVNLIFIFYYSNKTLSFL